MDKENSSNKSTQITTKNNDQEGPINDLRQDRPTISDDLARQINNELAQKEKTISDPINPDSCQNVCWNNSNN